MIDWVGGYGSRNLPYGVDGAGHVVVAYHQNVIDLSQLTHLDVGPECWTSGSLNAFMELGPDAWRRTQMQIQKHLADLPGSALRPMDEVQLVLPWEVADYVDFYVLVRNTPLRWAVCSALMQIPCRQPGSTYRSVITGDRRPS